VSYIELGTGSYILQLLLTFLLGLLLSIKGVLKKIKNFFLTILFRKQKDRRDEK